MNSPTQRTIDNNPTGKPFCCFIGCNNDATLNITFAPYDGDSNTQSCHRHVMELSEGNEGVIVEPVEQYIDSVVGTAECPVCGMTDPHTHTDAECAMRPYADWARKAFESECEGVVNELLDETRKLIGGSTACLGARMKWKDKDAIGCYTIPETQLVWRIFREGWVATAQRASATPATGEKE